MLLFEESSKHTYFDICLNTVCVCMKKRGEGRKKKEEEERSNHMWILGCVFGCFESITWFFFFLKHFLMTTSLNGWLYCNLFNKLLWNGLIFFCICNVINNVTVNDLCTYVLLLPYESTQGWFNGSKIFLVKILRLNN